jgi:hypothetical protein
MFVPLAPAAQNLGESLRRPYRGQMCGGMLWAMARIAAPQPNEAMARIALRYLVPQPNGKQKNFAAFPALTSRNSPILVGFYFFGLDLKFFYFPTPRLQ